MAFGALRIVDDSGPEQSSEFRLESQRDSDRILYSSALRRLAGVTQVISPQDDYIYHDRSMHSFKVAQVGYRLAQELRSRSHDPVAKLIDPDVVYAAGLAHDLGHPPFGHAAEEELQLVLSGRIDQNGNPSSGNPILRDTFEGNAQSFRILTRLAARKFSERGPEDLRVGLNLTWRTYAAMLKYPWLKSKGPSGFETLATTKWNAYDSESEYLIRSMEYARNAGLVGNSSERSVEAELMDWADDIAYAVHDTEDFFRAKLIPMARLSRDDTEWQDFLGVARPMVKAAVVKLGSLSWDDAVFEKSAENLRNLFPDSEYRGDSATRESLHAFASETIRLMTATVDIVDGSLSFELEAVATAEILKKLTRYYVIDRADLRFEQHGQRAMTRILFFALHGLVRDAWIGGEASAKRAMPSRVREYCDEIGKPHMDVYGTDEAKLARAVVDFMCSLTDKQAILLSRRLSGDMPSAHSTWISV